MSPRWTASPGGRAKAGDAARLANVGVLAGMSREGGRRQEGEREDVGRADLAHVRGVQLGQLRIVAERQRDGGLGRRTGGVEGGGEVPRQLGVREEVGNAVTARDVDAGVGRHRRVGVRLAVGRGRRPRCGG